MRLSLLCLTLTCAAALAQDPLAGLHRVALDDCGREGAQPRLGQGEAWLYPTAGLPTDEALRSVSFGQRVVYRYEGLKPAATYKLRLTFLSDDDARRQRVRLDGQVVIETLALTKGRPEVRVLDLTPAMIADGAVEVAIEHLAGPNAVISLIELFCSDPEPLRSLGLKAVGDLAGAIIGQVVDAEQKPAAGVTLAASHGADGPVTASSNAEGRFVLPLPSAWRGNGDESIALTATDRGLTSATAVPLCEVWPPRLTPLPEVQDRVSLDGRWQLTTAAAALSVDVPGEWAMQGAKVAAGETVTCERRLTVPAKWAGQRILLRFEAVYCEAEVLLDGQCVGGHVGGFTPFEVDLTARARPGVAQTLQVRARGDGVADKLASGSQYAAHPLGGITRSVRLFSVSPLHLARLHATTVLDAEGDGAIVRIAWTIVNAGAQPATPGMMNLTLIAPDNRRTVGRNAPYPELAAGGEVSGVTDLRVDDAQLWDPEHPRLYRVTARLGDRAVSRRIGLKQVEVRGNQVFCNNRPIKLRGICRHEVHPRHGRALRDGLWRKDAELFRAANINFIRTSHYPPAEEFLEACDEVGIFVEDEAPFCWAGNDAANRSATVRQALEMVERDLSHPSVLLWSVANESQWGANFDASAKAVQRLDPSRPRIFSYGELDVASWHYPGPKGPERAATSAKPVLFDEYCHLNCYNRRELDADPGLRDEWGLALQDKWDRMYATQACLGGAIWAGIDDIFMLPGGSEVGYGSWGPLDGWRRAKPEYFHVRKAYSPVRLIDRRLPERANADPLVLRVANRFDFTDFAEVRAEWRLGAGPWRPAGLVGAPRSEGRLTLDLPGGVRRGTVQVRFSAPGGRVIDSEEILLGEQPPLAMVASAGPPAQFTESAERLTVVVGRCEWTVDRATGQLRAGVGGRPVVLGGPHLMVLPLTAQQAGTAHSTLFQPANELCGGWRCQSVSGRRDSESVAITVRGSYNEAGLEWTLTWAKQAGCSLAYKLVATRAVNPRQIGLVFDLAPDCDTLSWRRDAQWSDYPADHIGRAAGSARPELKLPRPGADGAPLWPWAHDVSPLGSNDFRASRRAVRWASLTRADGSGWRVNATRELTTRAWRAEGSLRLLAASVDCGTSEGFVASLFADRRRPLKVGDAVEGEVGCGLLE